MNSPWVKITNNWLHDTGSGLWAACVVLIAVLASRQDAMTGAAIEAWEVVAALTLLLFRILLVSLAVIAITGGIRLAYWKRDTPASDMRFKRPALIGKHVAYLLVYGAGTWWAWTMVWPTR